MGLHPMPHPLLLEWTVQDAASSSRLEMQLSSCSRRGVGGVSANGCGRVGITEDEVGRKSEQDTSIDARKQGCLIDLSQDFGRGARKMG